MKMIRISDELWKLLNELKAKRARASGDFRSYDQIMLEELPDVDEYEPEDDGEDYDEE